MHRYLDTGDQPAAVFERAMDRNPANGRHSRRLPPPARVDAARMKIGRIIPNVQNRTLDHASLILKAAIPLPQKVTKSA
jgi:hypothetical protein